MAPAPSMPILVFALLIPPPPTPAIRVARSREHNKNNRAPQGSAAMDGPSAITTPWRGVTDGTARRTWHSVTSVQTSTQPKGHHEKIDVHPRSFCSHADLCV